MNINKVVRLFMIVSVLFIQIVFLAAIAKNNYETNNFTAILSIFFVTLIILFGYKYLDLHHQEYTYEKFSVAIWVPIGAIICHVLFLYTDFGSVLSAGIVGTLASFLPYLNRKSSYLQKLPSAIYCGVFVGMSSTEITPSLGFVISAGVLAGIFLLLSKNLFVGVGGKLGTMAFLGVFIVYLFSYFS